MMNDKLILIGSSNGSSNLGDLAMWQAAARVVRRQLPHQVIHTDGHSHWHPEMSDVEVHPFLYTQFLRLTGRTSMVARAARKVSRTFDPSLMWRRTESFVAGRHWSPLSEHWLELVSEGPLVVFTGAGGINDEFALHGVASWSAIARRALMCDGDVGLVGQGIGPLNNVRNRDEAWRFLQTASLLTTRDYESQDLVRTLGVSVEPETTPDWALLLEVNEGDRSAASGAVARYSSSEKYGVVSFHHWRASSAEQRRALQGYFATTIEHAANNGLHILCVANAVSSGIGDDRIFMQTLISELPVRLKAYATVVDEILEPSVVKALLAGAEFVISTRYHPVVFALGESTPVIPLHFDEYYRQKMNGAVAWYGDKFKSYPMDIGRAELLGAIEHLRDPALRANLSNENAALREGIEKPLISWLADRA